MLEQVIIMEIGETCAIAMKKGGALVRIRLKDGMQAGQRIYILPEDLYTPEEGTVLSFPAAREHRARRRNRVLRSLAGMAAVVVFMLSLILYRGTPSVYAVASFDAEQDLQLELDRKYRVVGGSSSTGQITEEEIRQLSGKPLAEIESQLRALVGDGPVLIGYASYDDNMDGDEWAEQLLREIFAGHVVLCLSGNGEDIDQSLLGNTSLGTYLMGEAITGPHREKLDDFLEAYAAYQDGLEDIVDSVDGDLAYLSSLDLDQLLDEILQNPEYEGQEDVLELLADKIEELHEEHKEQHWEDHDDEDEDEDEDFDEDDGPKDDRDD